jgi:hypothetical protein
VRQRSLQKGRALDSPGSNDLSQIGQRMSANADFGLRIAMQTMNRPSNHSLQSGPAPLGLPGSFTALLYIKTLWIEF